VLKRKARSNTKVQVQVHQESELLRISRLRCVVSGPFALPMMKLRSMYTRGCGRMLEGKSNACTNKH
jgi:hypothetical protein